MKGDWETVSLMRLREESRRTMIIGAEEEDPLLQQWAPQPGGRFDPALSCAVKISFNSFLSFENINNQRGPSFQTALVGALLAGLNTLLSQQMSP